MNEETVVARPEDGGENLPAFTPEEEDALWADDVYGPGAGNDDWEEELPAGEQKADRFVLKYMDEEKTVSREEVVTLAQKGMDYDRVRRRLDETGSALKEWEELRVSMGARGEQLRWMEELAREQGLSLETMLDDVHAGLLSGKTGMTREESLEAARRHREEWQSRSSAQRKRSEDIDAFFRAYPQQAREPGQIPRSVWEQVRRGETLLDAYRSYELEQLRQEVARQKAQLQKQQDGQRTTGSQLTRGTKWVDPFDAIWYNGE